MVRHVSKTQRETIRQKFGGKCAYCGCELGDRWHVDHFEPVVRKMKWESGKGFKLTGEVLHPDRYSLDNLMPACAPCNIDKGSNSLEWWRGKLAGAFGVLSRHNPTFRHALRFGLIAEISKTVTFHFERVAMAAEPRRPLCRDCADSDGYCASTGENCGFPEGHHLHRKEPFRPARSLSTE